MKKAFAANQLYTPLDVIEHPILLVDDGRIAGIFPRWERELPPGTSFVDFGDATLAPGFFDIHIHGGAGLDVMRASPSDLPRLGSFLASHGVTTGD